MVEIMDECDDGWKITTTVGINFMLQAKSSIKWRNHVKVNNVFGDIICCKENSML